MEKNNTNIEQFEYQDLVDRLVHLHDYNKRIAESEQIQQRALSDVKRFLDQWHLKHGFRALEEDVNDMVGRITSVGAVGSLIKELNDVKAKVQDFEGHLFELEALYSKLLPLASPFGTNPVIQKTSDYISSISQIHINQIEKATKDAILNGQKLSCMLSFFKDWKPKHDFRTIVEDVKVLVDETTFESATLKLQARLDSVKRNVNGLDNSLSDLESVYKRMKNRNLPSGELMSVKRAGDFLSSVAWLHISVLESALHDATFHCRLLSCADSFFIDRKKKYNFHVIDGEVGKMIDGSSSMNDIPNLQHKLDTLKEKLNKIENALDALTKDYSKLCKLPDLFGKGIVSNKISCFISSIPELRISQIDDALSITLPALMEEMQSVFDAHKDEKDRNSANKTLANTLLSRIKIYQSYADKFDCYVICNRNEAILNSILKDLGTDSSTERSVLLNVQIELDVLQEAFMAEREQFKALACEIEKGSSSVWYEEYSPMHDSLTSDNCYVRETVEIFRTRYLQSKKTKAADLMDFRSRYKEKVLMHFQTEYDIIRKTCAKKTDLDELYSKIEEYLKECNKKPIKIIMKIIGILAIVVLIACTWMISLPILLIVLVIVLIKNAKKKLPPDSRFSFSFITIRNEFEAICKKFKLFYPSSKMTGFLKKIIKGF